jgi:tripartite-type tricarboxylate transporter receptor subunit TctC
VRNVAEQEGTVKLPHRRQFLHLAAGAVALPAASRIVWAQSYPSRPVRIIVGQAAGSTSDIFARLMGQGLSERFGQQFVIETRPGAGTNIGTEAVVRASPDGYTLLLVSTAPAINATLYNKLNFNFIRDIAPVASMVYVRMVMEINPSVPAKTVPEFIAYAKANPGKVNFASCTCRIAARHLLGGLPRIGRCTVGSSGRNKNKAEQHRAFSVSFQRRRATAQRKIEHLPRPD